jgi:hypothetical protein
MMFSFSVEEFSENMINTFRCADMRIYFFTDGFHNEEEVRFSRSPINNASVFFDQYHEASRRTAAEQMSSPLRSVFNFMFKYPSIPEPRIWDPVTLSNLVSIGNNQWNQVGLTSD